MPGRTCGSTRCTTIGGTIASAKNSGAPGTRYTHGQVRAASGARTACVPHSAPPYETVQPARYTTSCKSCRPGPRPAVFSPAFELADVRDEVMDGLEPA